MANKENYAFLNYLKAFAAIFVVIHHATTYTNMIATSAAAEFLYYFVANVLNALFFCVSGYLCHAQKVIPYYQKKIVKILIPFVVFTSLKLIYTHFISDAHSHGSSLPEQLFDAFVCGNLYWFIYAILITYIISPLFWKLKAWNIPLLILIFAANIVIDLAKIELTDVLQIKFTLYHIGYFLAGYLLQQYRERIAKFAEKYKELLFFASLAVSTGILLLRLTVVTTLPYFLRMLMAFSQMYLLYLFAKKLPSNIPVLDFLGRHSLQIMFFDSFFKVLLFAILQPATIIHLLLVIVLNISLTCTACIVIKKIPYVRVLFGL